MNEACKHEWTGRQGPGLPCGKCGSKYYEWLSFEDWDYDGEKWCKKEPSKDVLGDSG